MVSDGHLEAFVDDSAEPRNWTATGGSSPRLQSQSSCFVCLLMRAIHDFQELFAPFSTKQSFQNDFTKECTLNLKKNI